MATMKQALAKFKSGEGLRPHKHIPGLCKKGEFLRVISAKKKGENIEVFVLGPLGVVMQLTIDPGDIDDG